MRKSLLKVGGCKVAARWLLVSEGLILTTERRDTRTCVEVSWSGQSDLDHSECVTRLNTHNINTCQI